MNALIELRGIWGVKYKCQCFNVFLDGEWSISGSGCVINGWRISLWKGWLAWLIWLGNDVAVSIFNNDHGKMLSCLKIKTEFRMFW